MKTKSLFGLLAMGAMMFTTSCQEEDMFGGNSVADTDVVTFTVNTQQVATRAYAGEGTMAQSLYYGVYEYVNDAWALVPAISKTEEAVSLPAEGTVVNIRLAKQKKYSVIFWAENGAISDGLCNVDWAARSMSVNSEVNSNQESYDAFWAYDEIEKFSGSLAKNIDLVRPFAQLNIGVSNEDWEAAGLASVDVDASAVTVSGVPTTMSLVDGTVGTDGSVAYASVALPEDATGNDWDFPVAGYKYLALNYVLVAPATDQNPITVELTYTDTEGSAYNYTFADVPVKRNFRTNIYGDLLTGNAGYKVDINEGFGEGDIQYLPFEVNGVGYSTLAEAVEAAADGATIVLLADVDFDADETVTIPAGKTLTLDLNGKTVIGVSNDADKNDDGKLTSADNEVMIDVRGTLTVKNGTITTLHASDNFGWNACTEVFYLGFNGTLNVENATIKNLGGSDMAYAIDLVNADKDKGVTLNIQNSTIESTYIPVRVFNNGSGMNNVTIENSTIKGVSRALWVHIYSNVDNGGKGVKDATLNLDIFGNGNAYIANNPDRIIEFGFDDPINFDADGNCLNPICASAEDFNAALENPYVKEINVTAGLNIGASGFAIKRDIILNAGGYNIISGGGSTKNASVSVSGEYDVTINDANFTGGSLMAYYGANVEINNVDLTYNYTGSGRNLIYAGSDTEKQVVFTINGGTFDLTGGSGNSYLCAHGNAIIYVKGGTFTGKVAGSSNPYIKLTPIGTYEPKVIITGGNFNFDPSQWVAKGYVATKNGDTWTVAAAQ